MNAETEGTVMKPIVESPEPVYFKPVFEGAYVPVFNKNLNPEGINAYVVSSSDKLSIEFKYIHGYSGIILSGKLSLLTDEVKAELEKLKSINVNYYMIDATNLVVTDDGLRIWIDTVENSNLKKCFLNYLLSDLSKRLKESKEYKHPTSHYLNKVLKDNPRLSMFFPNPKKLQYRASKSTSPNAKCSCGSGKKYKKCCQYKEN